jgi:hypothetical protein
MMQRQTRQTVGRVSVLVGKRRRSADIDPFAELENGLNLLRSMSDATTDARDLTTLKTVFAHMCRTYYTVSAISRRQRLEADLRQKLLGLLFPLRARIEQQILAAFRRLDNQHELWRAAVGKSFFGVSAKQGVSIRYPLATCVPTALCSGRCYGHDGRDRELHLIFRASLNGFVGHSYESATAAVRRDILDRLSKAIHYGVKKAIEDAKLSAKSGYEREPRIRFSHIGDMATTPEFTNALAAEISRHEPLIACVIYTRHPRAARLDPGLFRVNFTLDSADDPRRDVAPPFARLVSSAWDGRATEHVAINFLEHHVEKTSRAAGGGFVCPVTLHHDTTPTCDSARCDRCFRKVVS